MKNLRTSSKLGLFSYPQTDLYDYIKTQISFQKKVGFDAVDFSMPLIGGVGDGWRPYIEWAMECASAEGIKFEVCHLPFSTKINTDPSELPPFIERMHRAIDAASVLGVDVAVLHPNTTTVPLSEFNRIAAYDSVMAHLAPFAEHAARVGVKLAVENMRLVHSYLPVHRYCQDPEELCDIADALGIGVCWDFGHANLSGVKQSEGLAYVGSRLKVLHVNDNTNADDDHVPPFCGNVDWRDAMHGLALAGFDGLFNYELNTARVPAAAAESYAKYMLDSAHEMMSYIE